MRARFVLVLVFSAIGVACSGGSSTSTAGATFGDGGAGEGGAGSAGDGGAGEGGADAALGAAPATPQGICGQYVACVAATTPQGLGVVTAAYGKEGTCWTELGQAACAAACMKGLVQTHKAFPDEEACDVCGASADCPASKPSCDAATHRCIECASSADCAGAPGRPACDTTTAKCVACTSSADCAESPRGPICDVASHTCAMCAANADCAAMPGGPVCDASTKRCRACASDGECGGGGACSNGACVQCRTNADCPASASTCNALGACVACVDGSTCASGACNALTGVCCDPGTCAAQHVQCGFTIDPAGCGLFTEIPCGACPGAQNCIESACKDPPTNHCGAGCAGRCGFVPASNSYECVGVSSTCNSKANVPCSAGFDCESRKDEVTGAYYDVCVPYCLVDADCGAGGTCHTVSGVKGLGTCG